MLAIQNAVLCSDMGLSISPCGKMLALCASSPVLEVKHKPLLTPNRIVSKCRHGLLPFKILPSSWNT